MKISILILLFLITLQAYSQFQPEKYPSRVKEILSSSKPRENKVWVERNSNGDTIVLANLKNGMLHGEFMLVYFDSIHSTYNETGRLEGYSKWVPDTFKEIGAFKNNLLHGKHQILFSNRSPYLVDNYSNGIRTDNLYEYFENGQLALQETYEKGKRHGNWTQYYKNGLEREKRKYRDGVLEHSVIMKWYYNGNMIYENSFIHISDQKKPHGTWRQYYENGKIKSVGVYEKGEPDGEWLGYHENGKLKYKMIYKNQVMIEYLQYNKDGSIQK
ncbi:MAG: hypothetical protein CL840_13365 [Crocinitomicaceae bacterium]|nr:hypothetical protein [Crocinitomicaceae bacterium]|tara:strand:+ start:11912 stop:12727 length:816 start_codon:yes stop_codon:yes gene_type:complete